MPRAGPELVFAKLATRFSLRFEVLCVELSLPVPAFPRLCSPFGECAAGELAIQIQGRGQDQAAAPSFGNVDSISEEEMKIYLYFLASDQLEGRNLPSRGLDTASLYVASHLAEWGLKPGGSTTKPWAATALLYADGTGV